MALLKLVPLPLPVLCPPPFCRQAIPSPSTSSTVLVSEGRLLFIVSGYWTRNSSRREEFYLKIVSHQRLPGLTKFYSLTVRFLFFPSPHPLSLSFSLWEWLAFSIFRVKFCTQNVKKFENSWIYMYTYMYFFLSIWSPLFERQKRRFF